MYMLPGYVEFWEEDNSIYVTSKLRQNTVRLSDSQVKKEFCTIAKQGGCLDISSELSRFLHEQELLCQEGEIEAAIGELRETMNHTLLLTMMPTEGCNFRCPYCYEDHMPASMSRDTLEQIHRYVAEQAPNFRDINLQWFGGEPTLCKDVILETNELMQRLQKQNGFRFSSGMTTNGYLLCMEDFLKYFQAGITTYQITLDGWNHDKTRPHVTGKGTLDRILNNLTAISALPQEEYPYHITLRHNILPQDEDYSWYDHLYKLFGQDQRFSVLVRPVSDFGGSRVKSMDILKGESKMQLLRKHVEYLHKIGMPCINGERVPLSQICYASYPHSMVFRADGKIEKCTVCLDHPKNCVGYVDSDKGVILDETKNQLWCHSALKPECRSCPDVLSCLNMQCRKKILVDGADPSGPCSIDKYF